MMTTQMIIKDCKATIKELKGMKKDFDAVTKRIEKEMKTLLKLSAKEKKEKKKESKKDKKKTKKTVGRPRSKVITKGKRPVGRPRKNIHDVMLGTSFGSTITMQEE